MQTAREFARSVNGEIAAFTRALEVLSFSPEIDAGEMSRFRALAVAVGQANAANLALRELSGQHLVNTITPPGTQPMPTTADPTLRRADRTSIETRRPALSDLYVGAAGKRPYVSVVLPVVRDGEARFLLSMAITPERLQAHLNLGSLAGQGWLSAVVGSDGRVIMRTREAERYVGQPATADLQKAIAEQGSGAIRSRTLDGMDVFTAFDRQPSGWTTVVSVPAAVLDAPVRRLVDVLVLVTLLMMAATLLGAMLYGRRLSRELSTLADNAARLGAHRPLKPFNQTISEAGAAQYALQAAAVKTDELLRELDHRVKNTLSIIVSLVTRGVSDRPERTVLAGRIGALAQAHEALSRQRWEGVPLLSLVETVASSQNLSLRCEGPGIMLAPRTATCLAQTIQELGANARQHGSVPAQDAISLSWRVDDGVLHLSWREPASRAVDGSGLRPGFGLKLVELCIARQLDGAVSSTPAPGAWVVELRFPLSSALGTAAWPAGEPGEALPPLARIAV
ncbi:MAG: sensor histidine kinase [Alsobacter sp.]